MTLLVMVPADHENVGVSVTVLPKVIRLLLATKSKVGTKLSVALIVTVCVVVAIKVCGRTVDGSW